METALKLINDFVPSCEQEEVDKKLFIRALESCPDSLARDNLFGHFSASAWLMNRTKDKILCCYHKQYDRWQWLGGHCDGDGDFLRVVKKEITEESGLEDFELYHDGIFSLESFSVTAHYKNGKYVPAHAHWNVTYAFLADENSETRIAEAENSAIAWKTFEELIDHTPTNTSSRAVYRKLMEKTHHIDNRHPVGV